MARGVRGGRRTWTQAGQVTTASREGCYPHSRNGCPPAMSSSNIRKKRGWGLPTKHWVVQGQETPQLDHTLPSPRVSIYKVKVMLLTSQGVKFTTVVHSCLTLCDPMECSPPGSSVHGIVQASILEWVAISFSRGFF